MEKGEKINEKEKWNALRRIRRMHGTHGPHASHGTYDQTGESDDARYSFEFSSGNMMEVYDKEKNTSYVLKIEKNQYDETGNALNL